MQAIIGDIVTPTGVQSNSALILTAFINLHAHGGGVSGANGWESKGELICKSSQAHSGITVVWEHSSSLTSAAAPDASFFSAFYSSA